MCSSIWALNSEEMKAIILIILAFIAGGMCNPIEIDELESQLQRNSSVKQFSSLPVTTEVDLIEPRMVLVVDVTGLIKENCNEILNWSDLN